MISTLDY